MIEWLSRHILLSQVITTSLFCFPQWLHQFVFPSSVHKFSLFPYPCQYLLLVSFLIKAILSGVRSYLIVVLICLSLMINDADHLLMCLLVNVCFLSIQFFSFFNQVGLFLMLSCMNCLYILDVTLLLVISSRNIFSRSVGFFSFCSCFLCCEKFSSLIRFYLGLPRWS